MSNDNFIMKPKVDFCFKELMTDDEVRRGFIAAVLNLPPAEIKKTFLLPTHLRKEFAEDKLGILDVRVLLEGNVQIDIEMQVITFTYWTERSLFYLSKMYTEQIKEGDSYDVLKKCIHIGILDFTLFESTDFYSRFHIWEDSRRELYTDKMEIHILELPKLKQYKYPETALLNWAQFFNAETREEFEMSANSDDFVQKAFDRLINISADEQKRLEYEERQRALRDRSILIISGKEEGLKEGLEQGRKQGLEQGKKQGLKQGRTEGKAEGLTAGIKLAQDIFKLHIAGISSDKIADECGITEEEVLEILKPTLS